MAEGSAPCALGKISTRLTVWADLERRAKRNLGPAFSQAPSYARAGRTGRGLGRGATLKLWGGTVAPLGVELLLLVRLLVCDARLLGLLQSVAALVFLLHAVDEQGDQEGGEEGAHHPTHNHSCGGREQRSRPEERVGLERGGSNGLEARGVAGRGAAP